MSDNPNSRERVSFFFSKALQTTVIVIPLFTANAAENLWIKCSDVGGQVIECDGEKYELVTDQSIINKLSVEHKASLKGQSLKSFEGQSEVQANKLAEKVLSQLPKIYVDIAEKKDRNQKLNFNDYKIDGLTKKESAIVAQLISTKLDEMKNPKSIGYKSPSLKLKKAESDPDKNYSNAFQKELDKYKNGEINVESKGIGGIAVAVGVGVKLGSEARDYAENNKYNIPDILK